MASITSTETEELMAQLTLGSMYRDPIDVLHDLITRHQSNQPIELGLIEEGHKLLEHHQTAWGWRPTNPYLGAIR